MLDTNNKTYKQANFELFVVNRRCFQIYSGFFCDQPGSLTSKAAHNVLIFLICGERRFPSVFLIASMFFLSYIYL